MKEREAEGWGEREGRKGEKEEGKETLSYEKASCRCYKMPLSNTCIYVNIHVCIYIFFKFI